MAQTMLLRFFWTIYNMKTFFSFFVIVLLLLVGIQPISYADTAEPWEEELVSCIEQKNAASIHITVDNSGSADDNDPKGYRAISTSAITLGLQKIVSDLQSHSEASKLDIEVSASGFANKATNIIGWTNLASSPFTKQSFSKYNANLNLAYGGTSYTSAINMASQQFLSKSFSQSCDIWIFMTDGEPSERLQEIDNQITQLENNLDPFLIGVFLGESNNNFVVLQHILGELDGTVGFLDGDSNTFVGINRKAKVFKAENATDLLSAFLNIGSQLRSAAFDSSITDLENTDTSICTEDEECFYQIRVVAGTQYVEIRTQVTDPGNEGDITLLIEPPAALNINDALKKINGDLKKTQFGDTYISVNWITNEFAEIIIEPAKDKNSWVGNWRFALKADNPNGRVVTWDGKLHTKLVPNLPKTLSLREGQESCVDISYQSDTVPSDADVNLLIVDPADGSILKTIKATETRRGHQACIVPDGSLPNKIKLQTDITYTVGNKKTKADVATTDLIEVMEPVTYNNISEKPNIIEDIFKGSEVVEYVFAIQGGNTESVITIEIDQLTNALVPNIIWNVEFNGENYSLGTGENAIVVPKDFSGNIKLVGEPFESANSEFINYKVIFKSSSVEAPGVVDLQEREISAKFANVSLESQLTWAAIFFAGIILLGLIVSYVYSYLKSGLVYDRSLRWRQYRVKISNDKEIEWLTDNFYEDAYENTNNLKTSTKRVELGPSLTISYDQKLFPFLQRSQAVIKSNNQFFDSKNRKELVEKASTEVDINKLWILEIENELSGTGTLFIVASKELVFDQLKEEFKNNFSLLNLPSNIGTGGSSDTPDSDDGPPFGTEAPPPAPGTPPPAPGTPPPAPGTPPPAP